MKYLFCFFLLFMGFSSYCQEDFAEDEDPGFYSNFPDPFVILPMKVPHDSCRLVSFRERIFKERIERMYQNPEYYISKARELDFEYILLRIKDEKFSFVKYDKMIWVGELQRALDERKLKSK